jgi:hypothetical protein
MVVGDAVPLGSKPYGTLPAAQQLRTQSTGELGCAMANHKRNGFAAVAPIVEVDGIVIDSAAVIHACVLS